MYKCHMCDLETKQLNGLLSRHHKKHTSETYTVEQYKVDLLTANGRPAPICPVCSKPTAIPRGEKDYPKCHRECWPQTMTGKSNPNYQGGQVELHCPECGKEVLRHTSQANLSSTGQAFCSTGCSTKFHSKSPSESRLKSWRENGWSLQYKNPKFREKLAAARATMRNMRVSKKEIACLEVLRQICPDAVGSYRVKYYVFDMFVPSLNLLIEFDGRYWHSLAATRNRDKRKSTYITRYRPDLKLARVSESDWDKAPDKQAFLVSLL